jgi:hypothetical protein
MRHQLMDGVVDCWLARDEMKRSMRAVAETRSGPPAHKAIGTPHADRQIQAQSADHRGCQRNVNFGSSCSFPGSRISSS